MASTVTTKTKTHSPPPFRPSFLSFASGPLSPASPTSPITPWKKVSVAKDPVSSPSDNLSPPVRPLPWLWTCHQCGTTYPLAATRRCLQDGHYFCSGATYDQRTGITRRHRSCSSEFDYVGWTEWADWKKALPPSRKPTTPVMDALKKNCGEQCTYPSECRWGAKKTEPVECDAVSIAEAEGEPAKTLDSSEVTKEDIVEQIAQAIERKHEVFSLQSIREEDEEEDDGDIIAARHSTPTSPTSPLKQHYSLPEVFEFPLPPHHHHFHQDHSLDPPSPLPLISTSTESLSITQTSANDDDIVISPCSPLDTPENPLPKTNRYHHRHQQSQLFSFNTLSPLNCKMDLSISPPLSDIDEDDDDVYYSDGTSATEDEDVCDGLPGAFGLLDDGRQQSAVAVLGSGSGKTGSRQVRGSIGQFEDHVTLLLSEFLDVEMKDV